MHNVAQVLDETGLPPGLLELEISELTLMHDVKASIKVLKSLKDIGIRVAMDNFGTGYSSLRYLKHFSLDILKIGRLLTYDMIF